MVQPPYGFLVAEIKEESSEVSNRRLNSQTTDNDYNFYSQVLGHNLSCDPIQPQEFIKENLSAQKLKSLKESVNILNDCHMLHMVVLKINRVISYQVVSIILSAQ